MAEQLLPVRVVCADELGQIKVVQSARADRLDDLQVVAKWGSTERARGVECLAVGSAGGLEDAATALIAAGRADGSIDLLDPYSGDLRGRLPAAEPAPSEPPGSSGRAVRGVHLLWAGAPPGGAARPALLSCTAGGAARVHAPRPEPEHAWDETAAWALPPDLCCTAYDPGTATLAAGCRGAELRLYSVAEGGATQCFAAKGGRPNKVGLVDRPWNTALAFLPRPPAADSVGGGTGAAGGPMPRVLVGTGAHKLRLYDPAAGKRPQLDVAWGDARITALEPEPDGLRCWVGSGTGQVEVFDVRAGRFAGGAKGLAGSVRALAAHPSRPLLLSAGLDRFARLHDSGSRRLLGRAYLKTPLTGAAFCPVDAAAVPAAQQEGEAAEEGGRAEGSGKRGGGEAGAERKRPKPR